MNSIKINKNSINQIFRCLCNTKSLLIFVLVAEAVVCVDID